MFQMMLQMMQAQAENKLEQGSNAKALWFKEWAKHKLNALEPSVKVVYASAYSFPLEILAACDVVPFDFELSSAMLCSTEMGVQMMTTAEEEGLTTDSCAFHRVGLGAAKKGLFPDSDLFITVSYYCDGKAKTNEILSLNRKKESALLYIPSEINKDSIAYVTRQLQQIAKQICQITGSKLDEDKLKEAVSSTNRSRKLQLELLELLKHRPTPWSGQSLVVFSINSQEFTGSPTREKLLSAFIEELQQRIKIDNLRPEQHRLYWMAWVPAYPNNLFQVFKDNQVSIPVCETMRVFWDEIDEDNPFEGLALRCLQNPFVGPIERRIDDLDQIIDQHKIDGALLFSTPACRHSKTAYRLISDSCSKRNLPFFLLDMDIGDPRGYQAEPIRTRAEGFVELLNQRTN